MSYLNYHQQFETIQKTYDLINSTQGEVIGLYQESNHKKIPWYISQRMVDQMIPSTVGEHNLYIDSSDNLEVTIAGGYFTHCLARAVSHLLKNQYLENQKSLKVYLPAESIFTGHKIVNNSLIPETAYKESILDDTIQGVNLASVLETMSIEKAIRYIQEATYIGMIKYKAFNAIKNQPLLINIFYNNELVKSYRSADQPLFIVDIIITN